MKTAFIDNKPKYNIGDLIYTDRLLFIKNVSCELIPEKQKQFIIDRNSMIRNCCGNTRVKRENTHNIFYNNTIAEFQIKACGIDAINTYLQKEFSDLKSDLDSANDSIRKIREYVE